MRAASFLVTVLGTMAIATATGCSSDASEPSAPEGPAGPTSAEKDAGDGVDEPRDASDASEPKPSEDAPTPTDGSCKTGTWDDDGNTSTPCVKWTECASGTYVENVPSATTNRVCKACGTGTFSASANAKSCVAWTECASGEKESAPGTSTSDRVCVGSWTRQFGTDLDDDAVSVAVDASGNAYVAGSTNGELPGQTNAGPKGNSRDAYLRKYDWAGKELWTRQFGTTGSVSANAVGLDGSGNVYVVGLADGNLPGQTGTGSWKGFARKYDGTGKELWTRQFEEKASSVSVDKKGNLWVAGTTWVLPSTPGGGGRDDAYIRKYDGSGKILWTQQFRTSSAGSVAPIVSADGSGNVYAVGIMSTNDAVQGWLSKPYVRKYDGTGKELWTQQDFTTNQSTVAYSVSTDGSGNVYVAGETQYALPDQKSAGKLDAFVRKYDGTGKQLWTRQFGTKEDDSARAVSVDGKGNVYVGGGTYGSFPGHTHASSSGVFVHPDTFVQKFDGTGKALGLQQFGLPNGSQDVRSLSVDGSENVYLAGIVSGTLPGQTSLGMTDAFLMRLIR